MSNFKPIRKLTVELDRKFPETITYGEVDGEYYLQHGSSRHWDLNTYYFEKPDHAMTAMGTAATALACGKEVPQVYDGMLSRDVKF